MPANIISMTINLKKIFAWKKKSKTLENRKYSCFITMGSFFSDNPFLRHEVSKSDLGRAITVEQLEEHGPDSSN